MTLASGAADLMNSSVGKYGIAQRLSNDLRNLRHKGTIFKPIKEKISQVDRRSERMASRPQRTAQLHSQLYINLHMKARSKKLF